MTDITLMEPDLAVIYDLLMPWYDVIESWTFPFDRLHLGKTWKTGGCRFGAKRDGGRAHAGGDILQPHLTPVLAIADGAVLYVEDKFTGPTKEKPSARITDAIWVDHGSFVIRYGEIEPGSAIDANGKRIPKWRMGTPDAPIAEVKQGKPLAKVGDVGDTRMLHFEIYFGSADGKLSDKNNTEFPYVPQTITRRHFKRRWDLMDPTGFLNLMATNSGF